MQFPCPKLSEFAWRTRARPIAQKEANIVCDEKEKQSTAPMCVGAKDHVRYTVDRTPCFSSIARGSSVVSATVICASGRTKSGDSPSVRAHLRSKRTSGVFS